MSKWGKGVVASLGCLFNLRLRSMRRMNDKKTVGPILLDVAHKGTPFKKAALKRFVTIFAQDGEIDENDS